MPELLTPQEIMFTDFEPKMENRFIMYAEGIPAYLIRAANRPELANGKVTLDHINVKRYVKGRSEWQSLNITMYDAIVPSAAQAVMEWVRLSHESVTGRDGYSDFYKKDLTLNAIGGPGDKIEEWTLKGAFIENAKFSDLDYTGEDVATVELTLSIDYAILQY